jgi:hypothetical protein
MVALRKTGLAEKREFLKTAHVLPLIGKATGEAATCMRPGPLTFSPPRVVDARSPHIHPGVVVADFVANNLASVIHSGSWQELESTAARRIALPVRTACAPLAAVLPSAAASGPPRDAIRVACRGGTVVSIPAEGWGPEQAHEWIQAVARSER